MRHRLAHRKLNRRPSHRKSMLRNLSNQLITNGRLMTTLERAKELRKIVEPMVTMARKNTVAARRILASRLDNPEAVQQLFAKVAPANSARPGGYTRIMKFGFRPGDHARRALIEFVEPALWKTQDPQAHNHDHAHDHAHDHNHDHDHDHDHKHDHK